MEEMKKLLKVCIYAIGIICILGFVISVLGETISADIMTAAIFFFAGYGVISLIKKKKGEG